MRKITRTSFASTAAPLAIEITSGFATPRSWAYSLGLEPGARVAAHYHPIDEELVVVGGDMTFHDLTNGAKDAITVKTGEALVIPEGTVHQVTAGESGAQYIMGLPRAMSLDEFRIPLAATPAVPLEALVELVEINYRVAEVEEEPSLDKSFFSNRLSDRFVFVGALGNDSMKKSQFIEGLESRKERGRRSANLRLRCEGSAVLASLVVRIRGGEEFLNARLFEREGDGQWRCVRWANTKISAREGSA